MKAEMWERFASKLTTPDERVLSRQFTLRTQPN
jgi:hypothetical protein